MQGKYSSWAKFTLVRCQRLFLRSLLAPTVRWGRSASTEDGYTILIGCVADLPALLLANLECLARQDLTHAREVILIFEREPDGGLVALERRIQEIGLPIPVRVQWYGVMQARVVKLIGWPWVNAWMSWTLGLIAARTRYVVLQDLDAMLIRRDFLRRRYETTVERQLTYFGLWWYYDLHGIERDDRLVRTFELFFDAAYVKERFRPIDLFNHVTTYKDRSVEFDTLLYVESRGGSRDAVAAEEDELIHPTQLLCQYGYWQLGDSRLELKINNLLMLPYFMWVGGDVTPMQDLTRSLEAVPDDQPVDSVPFRGRPLPVRQLLSEHVEWMAKLVHSLDRGLTGDVRPAVREYTDALLLRVGKRSAPAPVA